MQVLDEFTDALSYSTADNDAYLLAPLALGDMLDLEVRFGGLVAHHGERRRRVRPRDRRLHQR